MEQKVFSLDVVSEAFRKYSTANGELDLSGFRDILSYLSDLPTASDKGREIGSGKISMDSKNEVTLEKKEISYRDTNNKNSDDNSDRKRNNKSVEMSSMPIEPKIVEIDDETESEDEISVEKVFRELAGKRKIVTLESIIGWDIVAELLEDGTVNIEVICQ